MVYFKNIEIENVGPIEKIRIDFPMEGDKPKPVIIVGENGTGKSILLSHLVNSLLSGKQEVFEDVEVEHGKVYKYRSPNYITSGKNYFYSSIEFTSGVEVKEYQLDRPKESFERDFEEILERKFWQNIPQNEHSVFLSTFNNHLDETSILFKKQCCLYFPVNRFEEPAWLNIDNLKAKVNYTDLKHISKFSNRNIICTSPLKHNRNWLLDLLLDRSIYELQTVPFNTLYPQLAPIDLPLLLGYSGPSAFMYEAVLRVLKIILREPGNIRLGAGSRKSRQIAVMKDEKSWVPNLFQLSTGEIQLLNLFLSIMRDYDLSEGNFLTINDIKGIVIIDEIDSHLHTFHQKEVLPELIALFPHVQFIITTHSPLFLLGMEEKLGAEKFIIFNMPNGEQVLSQDFSEFNAAYKAFKETTYHRVEIQKELEKNARPIVFVEGDYDIRYLNKAMELFGKNKLLEKIQLKDASGFGNLDKLWKGYDSSLSEVLPNKIILLYDCDTNKEDKIKGLVYKRVIPLIPQNPIKIGIENLFPENTIQKIEKLYPEFINTRGESVDMINGAKNITPHMKSINKDKKNHICKWLCENGTINDFTEFNSIFSIIEEIINDKL